MSEPLDLISLCCRATVDVSDGRAGMRTSYYICDKCGEPCDAVRPDRTPAPFDPEREKWVRK